MAPKECDPRCTGRCNKNRQINPVTSAEKSCDPRCTGRCNKRNVGTVSPPLEDLQPPRKEKVEKPEIEKRKDEKTADKACDPRCPGRCAKKSVGTEPPPLEIIEPPIEERKEEESVEPEEEIVEPEEELVEPEEELVEPEEELVEPEEELVEPEEELAQPEVLQTCPMGICQILIPIGQIKCIIMDLDGIILDIETVYEWVIDDLINKYGIPASDLQKIVDLQDEETSLKLCNDYKLPISPQDFMIEFHNTSLKHLANTPLMPGIEELIDYFISKNYVVAIASTSSEDAYILKTQKHKKFFEKFKHVVLGNSDPEVTARKPSPILYQICGSRFETNPKPEDILVFEDSPEGVKSAVSAGMYAVWFPNKYMNRKHGTDAIAILNSIQEFNPPLFGLPPI